MARINPEILVWARETAGFSLEEGARVLLIKAERLEEMERGEKEPTRKQLLKMEKKYRRSLLTFYLDKVPHAGNRGQDFRTVPGRKRPVYNATVDALIRDINVRQGLVRSLLEDQESLPLPFIDSANIKQSPRSVANSIRDVLRLNTAEFQKQNTVEAAFKYLRTQIEEAGIFVLLIGNLGSYHTAISSEVFRGFVISDSIAPFIVINDQDSHVSWSFTALHEVTHLWLGVSGISDASMETGIETFCNNVAAQILLPDDEIRILEHVGGSGVPFDEAKQTISDFALGRKVSGSMVAYRLFRKKIISAKVWEELKSSFQQDWKSSEAKRKRKKKQSKSKGGPNYYVVRRDRLGKALLDLVDRSLEDNEITYTKAGKVLGVKPGNVIPLLRDVY